MSKPIVYAVHGTTIAFDERVAELGGAETDQPAELQVEFVDRRRCRAPSAWRSRWVGEVALSEAFDGSCWWLRFHGLFDVRIQPEHLLVRLRAAPAPVVRMVLDVVVPMLLVDRGHVVLHGAGFTGADGATIVVGANGAGKSTLAGVAAQAGRGVLADDCVVVSLEQVPTVARGVPDIGLSPEVAVELGFAGTVREADGEKLSVRLASHGALAPRSAPLRRLVVLRPRHDQAELLEVPISRVEAAAQLAHHSHGGIQGPTAVELFDRLTDLVSAVPASSAGLPTGIARLQAALEASDW